MSVGAEEANVRLVHRFYLEGFVGGYVDVLDEIVDRDVVGHETLPPDVSASGRDGYKATIRLFRAAFSDISYEIGDVIARQDMVAARVVMRGRHTGRFMGIAPTGVELRYSGMDFFRCRGGRLCEHWANSDDLGLLQQLGALPSDQVWSRP